MGAKTPSEQAGNCRKSACYFDASVTSARGPVHLLALLAWSSLTATCSKQPFLVSVGSRHDSCPVSADHSLRTSAELVKLVKLVIYSEMCLCADGVGGQRRPATRVLCQLDASASSGLEANC